MSKGQDRRLPARLEATKWKKGCPAPNPSGRPRDLKAEVRSFADEQDPKIRKTRLRQWLEMADRRARQGSYKHLELLLSYGWGKPQESINLSAEFVHAYAVYRDPKLAKLSEAELKQLDLLTRKLLAPGEDAIDVKQI